MTERKMSEAEKVAEALARAAWGRYCDLLDHECDDDVSLRDGYIDGWQDGYEAKAANACNANTLLQLHKSAVNACVSWKLGEITQDDAAKAEAAFRAALSALGQGGWNEAIEAAVKWAEADRELAIDGLTDHVCAHLRALRRPAAEGEG